MINPTSLYCIECRHTRRKHYGPHCQHKDCKCPINRHINKMWFVSWKDLPKNHDEFLKLIRSDKFWNPR